MGQGETQVRGEPALAYLSPFYGAAFFLTDDPDE